MYKLPGEPRGEEGEEKGGRDEREREKKEKKGGRDEREKVKEKMMKEAEVEDDRDVKSEMS